MEYLVVIIGFILGALIFNWISKRGSSRGNDERRDPGRAGPAWQPPGVKLPHVKLPPMAHAILRYFPVTAALITICVVIGLLSGLGRSAAVIYPLLITDPYQSGFSPLASGEFWRLLTPIFVHFGIAHLFFNMFMLWDIGRVVEHIKGSRFVLGFTLAVGIASNLAQYLLTGSPFFGGMSGVLYGFFGYVWMQGKFNPRFGISLTQHTVVIMLAWFVLCWSGLLGPIANWAHTGGLVLGAGWGYLKRNARR